MVENAEISWSLRLNNNLSKDLKVVERDIKDFREQVDVTEKQTSSLAGSIKNTARDFSSLGKGLAATGSGFIMAGMVMESLNSDLGELSKNCMVLGAAISGIGSVTMVAMRAIGSLSGFMKSEFIMSIKAVTAALWAQHAALIAIGSATAIGLVIAGMYLLYRAMEDAGRGSKNLEKQIEQLKSELDSLRWVETSISENLTGMRQQYDDLTKTLNEYDRAINVVNRDLERAKQIETDLVDLALDLEEAKLNEIDAIERWQEAMLSGDEAEEKRAAIEAARASRRVTAIQEKIKDEQEEQKSLKTSEDLLKLETEKNAELEKRAKLEAEIEKQRKGEEEVTARIKEKEFTAKLLEWEKEGKALTPEEYAAFTGEYAPEWARKAVGGIPTTVTRKPMYSALSYLANPITAPGGVMMIQAGALETKEVTNPLFRDIVIQVNGTVSNQTIRVPAESIQEKAERLGYSDVIW